MWTHGCLRATLAPLSIFFWMSFAACRRAVGSLDVVVEMIAARGLVDRLRAPPAPCVIETSSCLTSKARQVDRHRFDDAVGAHELRGSFSVPV